MAAADTLILDRAFDAVRSRHTVNGTTTVLHCHHYSTLYTQLAEDAGMLDGPRMLAETSADTFYTELSNYFSTHKITDPAERISLVEQYYSAVGLGQLSVGAAGPEFGEVQLSASHLDEGWIKKYGPRDKPVNHITRGYLAGAFAAVYGSHPRSYAVRETASIVSGAKESTFTIVAQ